MSQHKKSSHPKKSSPSKKSSPHNKNNRRHIHQDYTSNQPHYSVQERADAQTKHNALSSKLREITDEHDEAMKSKHKEDEHVRKIREKQKKLKEELLDLEERQRKTSAQVLKRGNPNFRKFFQLQPTNLVWLAELLVRARDTTNALKTVSTVIAVVFDNMKVIDEITEQAYTPTDVQVLESVDEMAEILTAEANLRATEADLRHTGAEGAGEKAKVARDVLDALINRNKKLFDDEKKEYDESTVRQARPIVSEVDASRSLAFKEPLESLMGGLGREYAKAANDANTPTDHPLHPVHWFKHRMKSLFSNENLLGLEYLALCFFEGEGMGSNDRRIYEDLMAMSPMLAQWIDSHYGTRSMQKTGRQDADYTTLLGMLVLSANDVKGSWAEIGQRVIQSLGRGFKLQTTGSNKVDAGVVVGDTERLERISHLMSVLQAGDKVANGYKAAELTKSMEKAREAHDKVQEVKALSTEYLRAHRKSEEGAKPQDLVRVSKGMDRNIARAKANQLEVIKELAHYKGEHDAQVNLYDNAVAMLRNHIEYWCSLYLFICMIELMEWDNDEVFSCPGLYEVPGRVPIIGSWWYMDVLENAMNGLFKDKVQLTKQCFEQYQKAFIAEKEVLLAEKEALLAEKGSAGEGFNTPKRVPNVQADTPYAEGYSPEYIPNTTNTPITTTLLQSSSMSRSDNFSRAPLDFFS